MNCKNCEYGLPWKNGDYEGVTCTYEEGECVKITDLEKENAELKEQNIKLEQENELLKADLEFSAKTSNKNKQTVKEYQKLVDEYSSESADLQDRVKELEQENAELKAVERMALYSKMSDRLAKAEELLLELYDCIPSSMADSCKETLQKVALFFKDSEVEK